MIPSRSFPSHSVIYLLTTLFLIPATTLSSPSSHSIGTAFIKPSFPSSKIPSRNINLVSSAVIKLHERSPKGATLNKKNQAVPSVTSLFSSNNADYERAREIFSYIDADNSGTIDQDELQKVLSALDIPATDNEVQALFKYLDSDGSGEIDFDDEFSPWYQQVVSDTSASRDVIRGAIMGRKTVYSFDQTKVSDEILERAIECALSTPKIGRMQHVPWRLISLTEETQEKAINLFKTEGGTDEADKGWQGAPGWCVVTCKNGDDEIDNQNNFASTCCAMENFMLSMHADGIGTSLLRDKVMMKEEFCALSSVDLRQEIVVACVLFGFATGGLGSVEKACAEEGVGDVLTYL